MVIVMISFLSFVMKLERSMKYVLIGVICFAAASCSTQITRAPGHEIYLTGVERGGLRIDVAVVRDLKSEHAITRDTYNNNLRNLGMMVLDLKISNNSEDSYLINRRNISIIYNNGEKLKAMSERKTRKTTQSLFGLQLIYPDIKDKYRLWGLQDTIILSPGSQVSGYAFFRSRNEYKDVLKGTVSINAVRFYATDLFETTIPLQIPEPDETGKGS